jgi:protein-disulfide isomerase
VFSSPFAVGLAVLWLAGSASLVAFFPREGVASQTSTSAAAPVAPPVEALSEAQLSEWHAWLDAQPRETDPSVLPSGSVKVLVVKFNDYQCPACRATYMAYKGILEKWEAESSGTFRYETRDFPLESECGAGGIHQSACEGAVAVRLARGVNKGKEMEAWLFDRQAEITPALVKQGLSDVARVTNFDAEYPKVIEQVRADSRLGQKLGVNGTPTFYINGIKVPSLRPAYLDAAIAYLLKK